MTTVSKLDYLKKYMDGGASCEKTKKKKKKIKSKTNNIKIVDHQISFQDMKSLENEEHAEYDLMEEKPILFAADGATLMTKEYEEKMKKKTTCWAPVKATDDENSNNNSHKASRTDDSNNSDFSPYNRSEARRRHDSSDEDVSPPRKHRQRHDSDNSDISPQRQTRQISSNSKIANKDSDSDLSPDRMGGKKVSEDSDVSTERNSAKSHNSRARHETKPEVVSTGKKAGLQSGAELRKENELKRLHEKERFNNMNESLSGKGAKTVSRDRKSGKKIDIKFEELKIRREEEQKLENAEKYAVWGRGVVQENEHKQQIDAALHEMDKPLARYKDDKDLDHLLKEQERAGDPMLAYLSKKKTKQTDKELSKPKYTGPTPAPNRFNIWPGYRYDGVDRSNGFEKKRFMAINSKKSFNEAKYKWSVEEM